MKQAKFVSLKTQISRQIGRRILITFVILLAVVVCFTSYDIYRDILQLESMLLNTSEPMEEFVINEVLVGNSTAIDEKIKQINGTSNFEFSWIKGREASGDNRRLKYLFPFSWKYEYPLMSINHENFGYFLYSGSFTAEDSFILELLERSVLLVVFLGLGFATLFPLLTRIPQNLFVIPLMNILAILERRSKNKDNVPVNKQFVVEEICKIEKKIIALLEEEKRSSKNQALFEIASQVAHDIRSPVAAIMIMTKECAEIPEVQRTTLINAAHRIQDVANCLLGKYGDNEPASTEAEPFLVSTAILSVLSEKKVEYSSTDIDFSYESINTSCFCFIDANVVEFKRILSNLINNSVEAIADHKGRVEVSLEQVNGRAVIKIQDTGPGLPQDIVTKILNDEKIVSSKKGGRGLGLSYTRLVLQKRGGNLTIESIPHKGACIGLDFKSTLLPIWITDKIVISKTDCIIVLDDDKSIHGAWNKIFSEYLRSNIDMSLLHFTRADQCVDYISSYIEKDRIVLLADYELINQELNGLDVIEKTQVDRAILVTSYYESVDIIKRSILLKTKILPKVIAPSVVVTMLSQDITQAEPVSTFDFILLEDNVEFSEVISYLCETKNKKIKVFHTPYELLDSLPSYSKETKICVDYDIGCPVTGVDLAEVIYRNGFTNLYLATGFEIEQDQVPGYLTVLKDKMSLINL